MYVLGEFPEDTDILVVSKPVNGVSHAYFLKSENLEDVQGVRGSLVVAKSQLSQEQLQTIVVPLLAANL